MITQRIKENIRFFASKRLTGDKYKRSRNLGLVSDEYSENMQKDSLKVRKDISKWSNIMSYPTELWRHCVFPYFKMSFLNFCNKSYAVSDSYKYRCKIILFSLQF